MLPAVHGEFRAGTDPEMRFSPSGMAVCTIRGVASSRKEEPKGSGNWVDDKTAWVSVVGFGKIGEHMVETFQKGDLMVVMGKLEVQEWTDNENNKRITVQVLVDEIGPSIRWNHAVPNRDRNTGGGGSTQQSKPADDPWAAPQDDEPPF